MFCDFDGEFGLADTRCADNGDEFFHVANFLIFFELNSISKILRQIKILQWTKTRFLFMILNTLMFKSTDVTF